MFNLGNQPARVFTPLAAVVLGVNRSDPRLLAGAAVSAEIHRRPVDARCRLSHAHEVWKSVGTIVTEEGTEEIRPRTDIEWEVVHSGARTLMEAGNLLMMTGRAKDNDKWMEHCQELIEAAAAVLESSEAYDADAVFDRGELIYNACQGCHWEYRYEDDPSIIRTR